MSLSGNSIFKVVLLTGSAVTGDNKPSGRPIILTQTAKNGTLIHTADTELASIDMMFLYANNLNANAQWITLLWGGISDNDRLEYEIPGRASDYPLVLNRGLVGATSALTIYGFMGRIDAAGTASQVSITGHAIRTQ